MKHRIYKWLIAAAIILLFTVILSALEIRCFGCLPQINYSVVAYMRGNSLHVCVNNFPDKAFRRFILEYYCADGQKVLSRDQLDAITEMDCSGIGAKSLKGIEHFSSLQKLNCSNNQLDSLDPQTLSLLRNLDCSNNRIQSLALRYNSHLEILNCSSNQLTHLDIHNLNKLSSIDCSLNKLSNVYLFGNNPRAALKHLDCSYNSFKNLDLARLSQLTDLNISPQNTTMSYREGDGIKAVTSGSTTNNRLVSAVTSDGTALPVSTNMDKRYFLPKGFHDSVHWTISVMVGSRTVAMDIYSVMECSHQYDSRIFTPAKCIHCGSKRVSAPQQAWVKVFLWAFPLCCGMFLFAVIYLRRRLRKGKDWGEVTNVQIHDRDLHQPDRKR